MLKAKVALVTGGHDFCEESFFEMFRSYSGIDVRKYEFPMAEELFDPSTSAMFDAYVFYDCRSQISEKAKQSWLARLAEGKGCVFMHHSLTNHLDWDEFPEILGGLWVGGREFSIKGEIYGPPKWNLNQTITVKFPDPDHPIVSEMRPFSYCDETYRDYYISDKVIPLMETDHPLSEAPVAWTHHYCGARIVYLQPGQGPEIFSDPNYRNLLKRSILWVAGKLE